MYGGAVRPYYVDTKKKRRRPVGTYRATGRIILAGYPARILSLYTISGDNETAISMIP